MRYSELKIQIIPIRGNYLYVTEKAKDVLESIYHGKDQFIEMQCTDGCHHYINIDHIVEVKEIKEVPYDRMR